MSDGDRRTPGPSIDGIFMIPCLSYTEFFVNEVSGGPTCDEFDHFLGDRNKIAKNLKVMMKHIISLRAKQSINGVRSLKLHGLQLYSKYINYISILCSLIYFSFLQGNDVYLYSLTSPVKNKYMFLLEDKFDLPTIPYLLSRSFPSYIKNIWKLKVRVHVVCYTITYAYYEVNL